VAAVQWGDVATWVSGLATTGAVWFAGLQLREFRKRDANDRRVELAGVTVEWKLQDDPEPPEPDGTTVSTYVFTLHNPGRLPVTHVSVHVNVPITVQRVLSDGRADAPGQDFELDTPVVAGSGSRQWWRTLRLAAQDTAGLRDMTAVVRFRDLDGRVHENRWGRPYGTA
jgi:hypothetical protein